MQGKTMATEINEEVEERQVDEKRAAETIKSAKAEVEKEEPPRLQPIQRPWRATAVAIVGLFMLALFYTFYFARAFFLPLTLAFILNLLLRPLLNGLTRLHIPRALGAGLLIVGIVGAIVAGIVLVSEPASAWLSKAPETLETATGRLRDAMRGSGADSIQRAADQVEKTVIAAENDNTQKVELKKPGLMNSLLSKTTDFIFLVAETIVLLYFMMAAGDLLMLKGIQAIPKLKDKKRAVEIANEMQHQVSRYLGAISIVNVVEGTLIGIGLALVGMPNPILWGVMAALVNYVPYLGAMFCMACVTIVSLVTFNSLGHAMLPPAIYLFVNMMDNFLAPLVVGKRMVLNPLVIFLAVMFWGWIWGIIGVLLAVPITMAFKIFCDHFKSLAPIGELLAGEPEPAKGSLA
jgi:predicted PurR-regulated permease PerM